MPSAKMYVVTVIISKMIGMTIAFFTGKKSTNLLEHETFLEVKNIKQKHQVLNEKKLTVNNSLNFFYN